jgi:glycosyltransferase involved in cell wall biosynthesis
VDASGECTHSSSKRGARIDTGRRTNLSRDAHTPWLTVVIPSYCGERWIDIALQSLVCEAVDGIEVLVIDGSPTSATLDIGRNYMDRLRLRVFERRDLPSWQAKTNFGVQMAESNHVCWLGVDDVWLPGRANAARAWIDAAPNTALHLAPSAIVDKHGGRLGVWRCPLNANGELPSRLVTERLLVQNFVAAPAPIFRKDAWMGCGGVDEGLWYTADWDIWLKLAALGPVRYHDLITVGFRIHGSALTVTGSRDAAKFADQMHIVLSRHFAKLGGNSKGIERAARASIAVNAALASASTGDNSGLLRAVSQVLRLGPFGIHRYLRDSRILDRVVPRVRARLAGAL